MNAAMIFQGAELIATLVPLSLDVALKIKLLLEQDKDLRVDVRAISEKTIEVNDDTLKVIDDILASES
jgi:hypothetical protein